MLSKPADHATLLPSPSPSSPSSKYNVSLLTTKQQQAPSSLPAAAPVQLGGRTHVEGREEGAGVTPALMRCAQEERSRADVGRASGTVEEDGDRGGFEVASEGGAADYVESVGGGLVSNERRWKRRMKWGGDK